MSVPYSGDEPDSEDVLEAERDYLLSQIMIEDLRRSAARLMGGMSALTIQPTELVNMAFLKLTRGEGNLAAKTPAEMYGLYVVTMKNLLRDHLRRRGRQKRKGPGQRIGLDQLIEPLEQANVDPTRFLELLDELQALGKQEGRQHQVIVGRVFAQLTNAEIAAQLGISESTVEEDLRSGREWLRKRCEVD